MPEATTSTNTTKLLLRDISMVFQSRRGTAVTAIERLGLEVCDREFVTIIGPSGCGKSTLLRMVAGLTRPTTGGILLDGRQITRPGAERGMVFQSYTLFPWLTVQANVEYGMKLRGIDKSTRTSQAREYIHMVGLTSFEHHYPKELSGGMMQRVAIARALANDPEILLMDEPFGALDAQTRTIMQELLLTLWEQTHKTVLFVTHDIDEALLLSNRIYVMTARPGRLKMEMAVSLPRPRSLDLETSPQFTSMKRTLLNAIREESHKAAEPHL
jgi:NitT/TauT family transport system ATP-binding protein